MAAGVSGASGQCVVQTAKDSAAEIAQLQSPNMEDGCVTEWHWPQTTAPAACAHRVGNRHYKEEKASASLLSVLSSLGTVSL